eukprot:scaffold26920_cov49-Phaeocystis_antarctica.AAC.2
MAFSSAWRSSVQSRSTSGISKARMRSPAVDRTSSCSLATMSSGVSTGTYSLAASWYIITRRWLSSCACCARATIVAIVALACRSASKECSRTASMSFQTARVGVEVRVRVRIRVRVRVGVRVGFRIGLGALEVLGGAAVREQLALDDAQLLERVLGVDLLRLVRVLVLVLQPRGDLPVLLGLDAELEVGQVVAHDEHGDRDVRLLG